jgi:hypothetical protein
MDSETAQKLIESVTDERSFLLFLKALREDCARSERECPKHDRRCQHPNAMNHWESYSTKDFLETAEWWGGGDFADGAHYGDPILRRVATMLYAARFHVR